VRIIRELGGQVATVEEARGILELPPVRDAKVA